MISLVKIHLVKKGAKKGWELAKNGAKAAAPHVKKIRATDYIMSIR